MNKVTQVKSFFYAEHEYYRTNDSKNCVPNDIIANLQKCKNAIAKLGFSFVGSQSWNSRPAGCFYHNCNNDGEHCSGFFNQIIDPFKTSPLNSRRHLGAVCQRGITH